MEECGPGSVFASFTLALALQLRKKHGKTSIRVQYTYYQKHPHITKPSQTHTQLYSFLNFGARWRWVVNVTPRPFYPRKRPGTHCKGGWVGPRAGLDRCGKSRLHRDSIPPTVHPVASRYTD
jgi:hypothetical protein